MKLWVPAMNAVMTSTRAQAYTVHDIKKPGLSKRISYLHTSSPCTLAPRDSSPCRIVKLQPVSKRHSSVAPSLAFDVAVPNPEMHRQLPAPLICLIRFLHASHRPPFFPPLCALLGVAAIPGGATALAAVSGFSSAAASSELTSRK